MNQLDRNYLSRLEKDRLLDLLYLQIRNIWRVDGLYFLAIEKSHGTESAATIDEECWKTMGKLEARQLKELFGPTDGSVAKVLERLKLTSWALDQRDKRIEIHSDRGIFTVVDCGTQLTRVKKGLGEFPCKPIREGYLKSFLQELDPNVTVTCRMCPPNRFSKDIWCEWEFTRRR